MTSDLIANLTQYKRLYELNQDAIIPVPKNIASDLGDAVDIIKKRCWIPAEEDLPNNLEMVIACCEDGSIHMYEYLSWDDVSGGFYADESQYEDKSVIAWMPLPEPYGGY